MIVVRSVFEFKINHVQEKQLKQRMQDAVAEAIIAKNGTPLSKSEHEAIVTQIKSKAARAHAEILESEGMVTKGMLLVLH